jgi:hypothetical protein
MTKQIYLRDKKMALKLPFKYILLVPVRDGMDIMPSILFALMAASLHCLLLLKSLLILTLRYLSLAMELASFRT